MSKQWQDLKKLGHKEKEQQRRERQEIEVAEKIEKARVRRNLFLGMGFLVAALAFAFVILAGEKRANVEEDKAKAKVNAVKIKSLNGDCQYQDLAGFLKLEKGSPLKATMLYTFKTGANSNLVLELPGGEGAILALGPNSRATLGKAELEGAKIAKNYFGYLEGEVTLQGVTAHHMIWKDSQFTVVVKQGDFKFLKEDKNFAIVGREGHALFSPRDKALGEVVVWKLNRMTWDKKGVHGVITQPKMDNYQWVGRGG